MLGLPRRKLDEQLQEKERLKKELEKMIEAKDSLLAVLKADNERLKMEVKECEDRSRKEATKTPRPIIKKSHKITSKFAPFGLTPDRLEELVKQAQETQKDDRDQSSHFYVKGKQVRGMQPQHMKMRRKQMEEKLRAQNAALKRRRRKHKRSA